MCPGRRLGVSDNGHATDWHLVHIGVRISCHLTPLRSDKGVNRVLLRAPRANGSYTAVRCGRAARAWARTLSEDAGQWMSQIAPLKQIVDFSHSQGAKVGIQPTHAGHRHRRSPFRSSHVECISYAPFGHFS